MKSIKVIFYCDVPNETATQDEIFEWIAFHLGYNNSISSENPLINEEIEAESIDIE